MPSTSPKQARFMAAIDHGWKPDEEDAPSRAVAHEFHEADMEKHEAEGHKAALADIQDLGKAVIASRIRSKLAPKEAPAGGGEAPDRAQLLEKLKAMRSKQAGG